MEYFSPFLLLLKLTTKYCHGLWHCDVWYCHCTGQGSVGLWWKEKPCLGVIIAWGEKFALKSGHSMVASLLFLTPLLSAYPYGLDFMCVSHSPFFTHQVRSVAKVIYSNKWNVRRGKEFLQFCLSPFLLADFPYIRDMCALRLQITLKGMGLWIGKRKKPPPPGME